MEKINKEIFNRADEKLYHISLVADSLMYIGYGLMQQNGDDCEEGNAVQYIAHSLKEQIHEVQEMLFGEKRHGE